MRQRLALARAARVLATGGIVAYPTEAVYGLGCDPLDFDAVARLLALKRRPVEKGVILIGASLAQLEPWLLPLDAARAHRRHLARPEHLAGAVPALDAVLAARRHDTLAARHRASAGRSTLLGVRRCDRRPAPTSPAGRRREASPCAAGSAAQSIWCSTSALGGQARPTTIRSLATGEIVRA